MGGQVVIDERPVGNRRDLAASSMPVVGPSSFPDAGPSIGNPSPGRREAGNMASKHRRAGSSAAVPDTLDGTDGFRTSEERI